MTFDQYDMPDYIDWVAVSELDGFLLAVQWKRGQPKPTLVACRDMVRVATVRFQEVLQLKALENGWCLEMQNGEERVWVGLHRPDSPEWLPEGFSPYMQ